VSRLCHGVAVKFEPEAVKFGSVDVQVMYGRM
jgi:hypothetical protein